MANVFLNEGETGVNIANDGDVVFGQSGDEGVNILAGVTGVVLDQNVEGVTLGGNKADYTFEQAGNQLLIKSGDETVATVPVQVDADGTQLTFADGTFDATFDSGAIVVGEDPVEPTEPTDPTEPTEPTNPGETFTLSENVETIDGTTGDDTFNAYSVFSQVGQVATLQSGDQVNGGEGTDTLKADLFNNATVVPTLSSVEKLELSDYGTTGGSLNLSSATGITDVEYKLLVAASTLSAVGNVVNLATTNITGDRDLTVNYLATAVGGGTDNQMIEVSESDLDDVVFTSSGAIETVTINATAGSSSIDGLSGTGLDDAMTKVVITGAGNLSANLTNNTAGTSANTVLSTVDGSGAEGNLSLTVGVGLDQTIKTGSGDDAVNIGATLTKDDTIDLGEGTDSLIATGNMSATSYSKVTNVEQAVMVMNGADSNTTNTLNAGAFTEGISKATVQLETGLTSNSDDAAITGLAAGTEVVVQDMVTLVAGASDGTVDDVTITGANVTGSSDALSFTMDAKRSETDLSIDGLNAAGYETISINSTGAASSNANIENIINTLTDTSLKTLNITGDRELNIGTIAGAAPETIDASTFTADLKVAMGNKDQTVTGGSGDDTITVSYANLTEKDKVDGGDGTDTLALADDSNFSGSTNAKKLSNVSNFEKIGTGTAGVDVILDDNSLGSFTDNTVAFEVTADVDNVTLNVSSVANSSAKISVDTTKQTTATSTTIFTLSNGIDTLNGGAGEDIVVITDEAHIKPSDSIGGGLGNNNILQFEDQGAIATQKFELDMLDGISGFDLWQITDATATGTDETFDITISDTVAAKNANTTDSTLTVSMTAAAADDDTLKLDASAVSSSTKMVIVGGDKADTIKTGSGDDTITGGAGDDTITTGSGKDDVVLATTSLDTITDFDFGGKATADTPNVDQLDVRAFVDDANFHVGDTNWNNTNITITQGAITTANIDTATTDILIVTDQGYANTAAVETALEATTATDTDLLIVWQDTLGNTRVSFADDDGGAGDDGDDWALADVAMFNNLTIAGVKDIIDAGDFIVS